MCAVPNTTFVACIKAGTEVDVVVNQRREEKGRVDAISDALCAATVGLGVVLSSFARPETARILEELCSGAGLQEQERL